MKAALLAAAALGLGAGCSSSECAPACSGASATVCAGGVAKTIQCKGPGGCSGAGVCDTSTHTLGDDCEQNGALRCDPAMESRVLLCESFKLGAYRSCSGPRGCYVDATVDAGSVGCDFTVGDTCPPSYEGRFACDSVDNTQVLTCSDGGAVFYSQCSGGKSCANDGGVLVCQ